MIYYLCPGTPDTISGGTRKLYDHVAILEQEGFDARLVYTADVWRGIPFDTEHDIIVVPEVYGDGLRDFVPAGWPRISFVQNGYLTGPKVDGTTVVHDMDRHPFLTCPELVAIFTESEHTTELIRRNFPDLDVPLIRTHSSGNGRNGQHAGFGYGPWPRERRIVYFAYKHEADNAAIFNDLALPNGWQVHCMTGMTDVQIANEYRTSAVFVAANRDEGMCAPTSEAMICGAVIVCWTGVGPDEYLDGRCVKARQDDVAHLRASIIDTCYSIEHCSDLWAERTWEWSDYFQKTYSRQGEIDELVEIFQKLGQ